MYISLIYQFAQCIFEIVIGPEITIDTHTYNRIIKDNRESYSITFYNNKIFVYKISDKKYTRALDVTNIRITKPKIKISWTIQKEDGHSPNVLNINFTKKI